MIVWGGEGEWLFVGHSSRLLCHRILGVCSALNRSESIRDRNFEYVDVIVAMNNPCDRLTCSRLAFDVEREVWAPRCCVFINNISNSRIFAFRWHTTDWSTCSRSCGKGLQTRDVICRKKINPTDYGPSANCPADKKNPAFLRRFDIVTASIAWLIGTLKRGYW